MTSKLPNTPAEALQILINTKLRDFDKMDYEAFAGVESANPKIGESENGLVVVVDGSVIGFTDPEALEEIDFELTMPEYGPPIQ